MRKMLIAGGVLGLVLTGSGTLLAHCQVPCGIYDDAARIAAIREDITTIEKAVNQIQELSQKRDAQSTNQTVRWINTKEEHASHIIETVSTYFLTQKVKAVPDSDKKAHKAYLAKLADHHAVMRAAMKTKQTVSADTVAALKKAVDGLQAHYEHDH